MDDSVDRIWREVSGQLRQLQRLAAFWGPAQPVPGWLAPGVAIGALLALVLASGVALVSIAALLTALFVAHLVLENVFGVRLDVKI
jgi:integral membrane sensor domain MASE1